MDRYAVKPRKSRKPSVKKMVIGLIVAAMGALPLTSYGWGIFSPSPKIVYEDEESFDSADGTDPAPNNDDIGAPFPKASDQHYLNYQPTPGESEPGSEPLPEKEQPVITNGPVEPINNGVKSPATVRPDHQAEQAQQHLKRRRAREQNLVQGSDPKLTDQHLAWQQEQLAQQHERALAQQSVQRRRDNLRRHRLLTSNTILGRDRMAKAELTKMLNDPDRCQGWPDLCDLEESPALLSSTAQSAIPPLLTPIHQRQSTVTDHSQSPPEWLITCHIPQTLAAEPPLPGLAIPTVPTIPTIPDIPAPGIQHLMPLPDIGKPTHTVSQSLGTIPRLTTNPETALIVHENYRGKPARNDKTVNPWPLKHDREMLDALVQQHQQQQQQQQSVPGRESVASAVSTTRFNHLDTYPVPAELSLPDRNNPAHTRSQPPSPLTVPKPTTSPETGLIVHKDYRAKQTEVDKIVNPSPLERYLQMFDRIIQQEEQSLRERQPMATAGSPPSVRHQDTCPVLPESGVVLKSQPAYTPAKTVLPPMALPPVVIEHTEPTYSAETALIIHEQYRAKQAETDKIVNPTPRQNFRQKMRVRYLERQRQRQRQQNLADSGDPQVIRQQHIAWQQEQFARNQETAEDSGHFFSREGDLRAILARKTYLPETESQPHKPKHSNNASVIANNDQIIHLNRDQREVGTTKSSRIRGSAIEGRSTQLLTNQSPRTSFLELVGVNNQSPTPQKPKMPAVVSKPIVDKRKELVQPVSNEQTIKPSKADNRPSVAQIQSKLPVSKPERKTTAPTRAVANQLGGAAKQENSGKKTAAKGSEPTNIGIKTEPDDNQALVAALPSIAMESITQATMPLFSGHHRMVMGLRKHGASDSTILQPLNDAAQSSKEKGLASEGVYSYLRLTSSGARVSPTTLPGYTLNSHGFETGLFKVLNHRLLAGLMMSGQKGRATLNQKQSNQKQSSDNLTSLSLGPFFSWQYNNIHIDGALSVGHHDISVRGHDHLGNRTYRGRLSINDWSAWLGAGYDIAAFDNLTLTPMVEILYRNSHQSGFALDDHGHGRIKVKGVSRQDRSERLGILAHYHLSGLPYDTHLHAGLGIQNNHSPPLQNSDGP